MFVFDTQFRTRSKEECLSRRTIRDVILPTPLLFQVRVGSHAEKCTVEELTSTTFTAALCKKRKIKPMLKIVVALLHSHTKLVPLFN